MKMSNNNNVNSKLQKTLKYVKFFFNNLKNIAKWQTIIYCYILYKIFTKLKCNLNYNEILK